jgi:metalloendopeptidase OMA1, mitochondrial
MYYLAGGASALLGGFYVSHLEKVPSTGRTRFMSISSKEEEYMSRQAYESVVSQYRQEFLPPYHPLVKKVKNVAERLIQVSGMSNLNWEFNVINSSELNAFVLPGGKIFVFTGIFEAAETDDQLAAVLSHEIAHQILRHSAEKMSFFKLVMWTRLVLSFFFDTSLLFHPLLFNLLFNLPFSRNCETEADFIGLMLMSQACFEPEQAVQFWKHMKQISKREISQFVSTHPSSDTRIQKIKSWMPEAKDRFHTSNCQERFREFHDFLDNSRWAKW